MSEKIKTSHFKTMEELLEHLKMWEKDDDYHAYCRFFDYECAYEMTHKIDRLQKELDKKDKEIENYKKGIKNYKKVAQIYVEEYVDIDDFIGKVEEKNVNQNI